MSLVSVDPVFKYNINKRDLFEVSASIVVETTVEELWKALTRPEHVCYFNCFVEKHECSEIKGLPHQDSCTYYNGKELFRTLNKFEPQRLLEHQVYFNPKN